MQFTYQNPLLEHYLADPYILRWRGEYFVYGTGSSAGDKSEGDARVFPLFRSRDLVTWEDLGGALTPLPGGPWAYWAPEVAEHQGRFYLYYSAAPVGKDEDHRLRVAIAENPAGPFVDSGNALLPDEGFSIDANPFRDPRDGQWYLFFARDYFDERVGTGIAVVPLTDDMRAAAGPSRPAVRASANWQIYERNRFIYGRRWDAWHTVEGPCVVAHEGRYYCFYSGGNWQTEHYGVSVAVADHPLGPWHEADTARGPKVLHQVSERVLGPGHNSVTLAPDGRTPLIVYHAWDLRQTGRRLCIDPLEWTPEGPRCPGPSTTRQTLSLA